MQRIFPEHEIRPVVSLDGMWQLTAHDEKKTSVVAGVPGVWERIPALARFRGKADYARKVQVCRDGNDIPGYREGNRYEDKRCTVEHCLWLYQPQPRDRSS